MSRLTPLFIFVILGLVFGSIAGLISIWMTVFGIISITLIGFFVIQENGFGIRGVEMIVFIIVGGLMLIFIFPIINSDLLMVSTIQSTTTTTVTSNSTTTEETILAPINSVNTTAWTSGVTTLFMILLPLMVTVAIFTRFLGIWGEDYYDDTGRVHIGRTYRQYGYDYHTEQDKFQKDILDMDKIFRSET